MSTYNKPYLTFQEQLELLKSRGLEITNDVAALEYLERLGYYRLSGYLYPFRKLTLLQDPETKIITYKLENNFIPGAKFEDAVNLYIFDKKLRLLISDTIERIEVAIRVDIAYLLGKKDRFAHMNPDLLHGNFTKKINPFTGRTKYRDWLLKQEQLVNRSKEDFVQHYQTKYGMPLPIWVEIELWDFGLLSVFYQGMTVNDKDKIAAKYKIPSGQIMQSWLRCLNYVRNVVAHHSRLWNKNLVDQPKLPKPSEIPAFDSLIGNTHTISRVYIALRILIYFIQHICPRSAWTNRLNSLINNFPEIKSVSVSDMGFPADWKKQLFWKN